MERALDQSSHFLNRSRETIFLLHGIGANRWHTAWLARRLSKYGYRVINRTYNSLFVSLDDLGKRFLAQLEEESQREDIDSIHIVGHSMGTIVARVALAERVPAKMKRVVLLTPPNHGTHAARYLAPIVGRFLKPVTELTDDPASFVNRLPNRLGLECGIVTSSTDWIVPHHSTYLSEESDRIEIKSIHSMIVFRKETARQIDHFLRYGCFCHSSERTETESECASSRELKAR